MNVLSKRYYGTTCHIVSFLPSEIRLEDVAGIVGKREPIQNIYGNPKLDEVVWFRSNRSYFNTNDPTSETMGDNVGDVFINVGLKFGNLYFEPFIPEKPEWSVGASYMLLRDGENNYDSESAFSSILGRNPRTFFGQRADGTIVFIAADGRRTNELGLTSNQQRGVCKSEGIKNAANLDGGGSSVIMVGNTIINKSYDGRLLGKIFCGYRKYSISELNFNVKLGDSGVWVNLIQRLLNIKADAYFGTKTETAVKDFQLKNGALGVDGVVGPKTWAKLFEIAHPVDTVPMPRLIIDAGHGGDDSGAAFHGYLEKDLNLVVARRVSEILKKYNPDMTRVSDIALDKNARCDKIKDKYTYCLAIHFNANAGSRIETIYSIFSDKGKKLAECIGKELSASLGLTLNAFSKVNPKNGKDWYYYHYLTGSTITVIVECLPLDTEYGMINVEVISQAIARGYIKFLE